MNKPTNSGLSSPGFSVGAPQPMPMMDRAFFSAHIQRERARSDRSGVPVVLVIFESHKPGITLQDFEPVVNVLTRHARATDAIGWLSRSAVAILLYHVSQSEAAAYIARVEKDLAPVSTGFQCLVRPYPGDWEDIEESGRVSLEFRSPQGSPNWLHKIRAPQRYNFFQRLTILGVNALASSPSSLAAQPLGNPYSLFVHPMPLWKRIIDVLGASAALVVLSPLMFAIALAIRCTSKGPAIFRQERMGYRGRAFTCFKFRTMVLDADERKVELLAFNQRRGVTFKMEKDPRVTRIGDFLRKTSLDELPQFYNVLIGDMSLVGPRPLPMEEGLKQDPWHRARLEITPGITCLWQIFARHAEHFDDMARLDIEYARKRSFGYDLKLLLLTLPAVLLGRGAH